MGNYKVADKDMVKIHEIKQTSQKSRSEKSKVNTQNF
jgi:hypothetical protein